MYLLLHVMSLFFSNYFRTSMIKLLQRPMFQQESAMRDDWVTRTFDE